MKRKEFKALLYYQTAYTLIIIMFIFLLFMAFSKYMLLIHKIGVGIIFLVTYFGLLYIINKCDL